MQQTTQKSIYLTGVRDGSPFIAVIIPFGLLFGVVASEAGLNIAQVLSFSILVVAGTAQFTAIQLMVEQAPTLIVIATALAVNLRMAMYSAAMTPHLGHAPLWKRAILSYLLVDQSYAVSILKYEAEPDMTLDQKMIYFFGVISPVAPLWYLCSWLGAVIGESIPLELGLDFAVPLTFIAMISPSLRTIAHIAAAATAVVLGLVFAFMPFSSGLLVAAMGAMAVGAEVERRSAAS